MIKFLQIISRGKQLATRKTYHSIHLKTKPRFGILSARKDRERRLRQSIVHGRACSLFRRRRRRPRGSGTGRRGGNRFLGFRRPIAKAYFQNPLVKIISNIFSLRKKFSFISFLLKTTNLKGRRRGRKTESSLVVANVRAKRAKRELPNSCLRIGRYYVIEIENQICR